MSETNKELLPITQAIQDVKKVDLGYLIEQWNTRANAVRLAGSAITDVSAPEAEEAAKNFIIKARRTLNGFENAGALIEGVKEGRLKLTRKLDVIKSEIMKPEKVIEETIAGVQALLDAKATEELKKAKVQAVDVNNAKEVADEVIRLKDLIRRNSVNKTVDALTGMNERIKNLMPMLTAENFHLYKPKFDVAPKLSQEIYESFFAVPFNHNVITQEAAKDLIAEMKAEITYEECNAKYAQLAQGILKMWKDDLPKIEAWLLEGKQLTTLGVPDEDPAKVGAMGTATGFEILRIAQQLREGADEKNADEVLQAEVQHQVSTQAAAPKKGAKVKRVATLSAPDSELAKVFGKIIYAIFVAKGPKAHLKADGSLCKWAEELLKIQANDTDAVVEGVKYEDVAKVVTRA